MWKFHNTLWPIQSVSIQILNVATWNLGKFTSGQCRRWFYPNLILRFLSYSSPCHTLVPQGQVGEDTRNKGCFSHPCTRLWGALQVGRAHLHCATARTLASVSTTLQAVLAPTFPVPMPNQLKMSLNRTGPHLCPPTKLNSRVSSNQTIAWEGQNEIQF